MLMLVKLYSKCTKKVLSTPKHVSETSITVSLLLVMVSKVALNITSLETLGVPAGVTKATSRSLHHKIMILVFVVFNMLQSTQPLHEKLKELR